MSDHGHPAEAHVSLRRCCSADLTWHSRRGGRARRSYVSALEGTRFDRRAESEPREIPRRDASRRRARSAHLRTRVRADHHPLPRSPASRSLARDRRPGPPRHGDNADALPPASQDTGTASRSSDCAPALRRTIPILCGVCAESCVQSVSLRCGFDDAYPCPSSRPRPAIPRDALSARRRGFRRRLRPLPHR